MLVWSLVCLEADCGVQADFEHENFLQLPKCCIADMSHHAQL